MELNNANYFSKEANLHYMSASQFKAFEKCEYAALQEILGQYSRAESTALLVGSYVDAFYEGTLELFVSEHPDIVKRDGTLKAEYRQADLIIERLKADDMFSKFMSGEKQVVMTGKISDSPVKVKIDSFLEGQMIVDLKVMRDFKPVYVSGEGKLNFIEAWGYDIQGAIYQEIVYQNTGKRLPFYIAAATKESATDLGIFEVPQSVLDERLFYVEQNIDQYQLIKSGDIEPVRCEKCDCCKETKKLKSIISWEELNEYEY